MEMKYLNSKKMTKEVFLHLTELMRVFSLN